MDQDLAFDQVLADPDLYHGKIILLGGEVIETLNLPGVTKIIVLQRPFGYGRKPDAGKASQGRFIITSAKFLDPAIYRRGRKMTVVASVKGKEVRPLGEIRYSYPVLQMMEIYLWPDQRGAAGPSPWRFGVGIGVHF